MIKTAPSHLLTFASEAVLDIVINFDDISTNRLKWDQRAELCTVRYSTLLY